MYDKAIESFHMLWNSFPIRARLIQKDRTVIAVNRAAEAEGMTTGVRCIDTPPKESHAGCLANSALSEHCGKCAMNRAGDRLRFWIPVEGFDDLFVHFSVPESYLR